MRGRQKFANPRLDAFIMSDPILLDLPFSIETERLTLRPPRAGDGPMVFAAVTESLPELRRFLASLPWVGARQSIESSEIYCRTSQANFVARRDFPFLLLERATGELVGASGLHRADWATPKVEVGYWCRTSRLGNGFVSEAVLALTQFAFSELGMARVELITDESNERSRRLAERCNFQLEGTLRNDRRAADGVLRSTCIYARLAPAAEPDEGES
jgi:RimJ/RimL family protein N-acetyltransferase